MSERIGDPVLRSDVLNNVAAGELLARRDWTGPMLEALRLGLEAGADAQAGRAYANAYTFFLQQFRFAEGERFWRDGIAYCDERDIPTYSTCLRGHRAIGLLDLGRWDEAAALAGRVLATEASPVNLLTSQVTLGLVRARRGVGDPFEVLDAAVEAAEGVDETEWVACTRLARAEARWLAGDEAGAVDDLRRIRARITPVGVRRGRPAQRVGATPARYGDPGLPCHRALGDLARRRPRRRRATRGTGSDVATTPRWRSTTPTATTTCVRRSPASRCSAPTPPYDAPASG